MSRALVAAAPDLILEHGPLPLDRLHAFAVEHGWSKSRNASTLQPALDAAEHLVRRPDGRYDTAARLLAGQVFTTRPRPGGRDDVLWTYRDLDPLAALPSLPLATGGCVRRGDGPVESWLGPAGWLPPLSAGQLVALRWDGRVLHVQALDAVPAGDSDAVRDVREVLGRHGRAEHRYGWSSVPRTSLTRTVVSALVEEPQLFASPLPPLRELLPLPEDLRPSDVDLGRDPEVRARLVEVPLPHRVHDELSRRADLIGERLPDYLTLLLGAAADRVLLAAPHRYERYEPYDGPYLPEGGTWCGWSAGGVDGAA